MIRPPWGDLDSQPLCPSCLKPVDMINWADGMVTCGKRDCIVDYVDRFINNGWVWDGKESHPIDSQGRIMAEKPTIRRETKPDGGFVLIKETGPKPQTTPASRSGGTSMTVVKNTVGQQSQSSKPAPVFKAPYDLSRNQVYITPQCWLDLRYVVAACPIEISGLGLVETTRDGLVIKDIFLLEQLGGSAHTSLDPEAQAKLMYELDQNGVDTGMLRFWWHTHPASKGKPSPSGQDMEQFAAFGRGAPGIAPDWFINGIFSQNGDAYWRMDVYRPIRTAIEISPSFLHPDFTSCNWEEEINAKVTRGGTGPTVVQGQLGYGGHCGGRSSFAF